MDHVVGGQEGTDLGLTEMVEGLEQEVEAVDVIGVLDGVEGLVGVEDKNFNR